MTWPVFMVYDSMRQVSFHDYFIVLLRENFMHQLLILRLVAKEDLDSDSMFSTSLSAKISLQLWSQRDNIDM